MTNLFLKVIVFIHLFFLQLVLKEHTVLTVKNVAPVRTKVSATLKPGHASALQGSLETVVKMVCKNSYLMVEEFVLFLRAKVFVLDDN